MSNPVFLNRKHARLARIAVSVASVTALFLPATSLAGSTASASSYIYGTYGGPRDSQSMNGANGQTASANASVSAANSQVSSNGTASAFATEGLLRASFDNYTSTNPAGVYASPNSVFNINGRVDSYARATWYDNLIIDGGSALQGQRGYFTATLDVTGPYGGAMGPTGSRDSAEYFEKITIQGTGITTGYNSWCNGSNVLCNYEDIASGFNYGSPVSRTYSGIPGTIALNIPVFFGSNTGISYTLDLTGLATATTRVGNLGGGVRISGSGTFAHAFADYGHSLAWGGITGVFDASGHAVSNFTTTSTSGFNYAALAAVPESETYAMLLAGLGLLGFTARRNKNRAA